MNKVILIGRLTKTPEVRYSNGEQPLCVVRYTLAVDRKVKKDQENTADFINCVVFGKAAEFAEKFFDKGIKIVVTGRLQTRNYENKEGQKVYVTEVIVEEQEFVESKATNEQFRSSKVTKDKSSNEKSVEEESVENEQEEDISDKDGFVNIPDDLDDEDLPF